MTPYKYSDLKQEVALLRQDLNNMRAENERMKESIDRLVNMTELIMERVNENRNDIIRPEAPLAGPSQTATPLLSKVLKAAVPKTPKSLLIQGNKDFGDPEKIRAYFKELVDADPDTKGKSEDFRLQAVDSSIKNVRPIVLSNAKKLLRDMKNTTGNEQGLYWQKVPEDLKKKRIIDIENQAAFLGINLTECQDHWVALALLRKSYQNNCNPKKDEENKKKKAKGKGKERENPVSNKTIVIDKEVLDFLDECESLSGEEEHQKDQEDESEEEGPVLKRRRI